MKHQKNVERLISRCESALSGKSTFSGQEWKLPRYVAALEEQLRELEKLPNLDPDLLKSYQQKLSVLREVLRNEDEPQGLFTTSASTNTSFQSSLQAPSPSYSQSASPVSSSSLPLPPRAARGSELLLKTNNRKLSSLRDQLFSKGSETSDSLRQRQRGEELVRHHEQIQEEVAEDMIKMARSLKSNATIAKDIISQDSQTLKKTTEVAEENITSVKQKTDKLKEHNRGCNWGIWIILLIVFLTFITMIIFIRIFPKPRY